MHESFGSFVQPNVRIYCSRNSMFAEICRGAIKQMCCCHSMNHIVMLHMSNNRLYVRFVISDLTVADDRRSISYEESVELCVLRDRNRIYFRLCTCFSTTSIFRIPYIRYVMPVESIVLNSHVPPTPNTCVI